LASHDSIVHLFPGPGKGSKLTQSRPPLFRYIVLLIVTGVWLSSPSPAQPQGAVTKQPDGIVIHGPTDSLRIAVCGDSVLHIMTSTQPDALLKIPRAPWILQDCTATPFSLSGKDKSLTLATSRLQVTVALDAAVLTFADASGKQLLREKSPRSYTPIASREPALYQVTDRFLPDEDDAIFGLGQHQSGAFNYRGSSVILSQNNTDVAIPFFLSTMGYGVLWNTAASTLFDNRLPHDLDLVTSAATGLDYYFIYGPEPDELIHQYRDLTGHAPMYGKWAYGLFQSKDHYETQQELLRITSEYRDRHIPLDTIVQDYQWWTKQGSAEFNSGYPDMTATVAELHKDDAHLMISIWPDFDKDTLISSEMRKNNWLLSGTDTHDPTNPAARDLYWKALAGPLLARGIDAFWLDATEPELPDDLHSIQPGSRIFLGDSRLYTNVFPYMTTYGIYQHWRDTTSEKRVFLLSRSAFLGSQKTAAATWSGDVYSTFWSLSRQVPAGLNFALSGLPYWTTDIGGYGYPAFRSTDDPAFQELFTRWFEFGTFCPIFRIHGYRENKQNEIYSYGSQTPTLIRYDKLRYRMLPYIYSLAWRVTNEDYTMMRPLVMDWRSDPRVWNLGDEFMFGPAMLISPVTRTKASTKAVYLPRASAWYDFWTGEKVSAGQIEASAPLDRIPIYVRAGAILPLGPEIEYAAQKPGDPIEIRIYRGADGSFDLYEDEGDSYRYEQGARSIIPLRWNDATATLTIGSRIGSYPGMSMSRRFNIVLVNTLQGNGPEVSARIDKEVTYSGNAIQVTN
jgi:alpha-D-xyloside xylohydrolase